MGANMKHYTKDGLYDGPKHKMDDGSSHTGKTHTKASKVISHKKEGPFKLRDVNSPMRCWKTHKKIQGMADGAKGSCEHKDPAQRPK